MNGGWLLVLLVLLEAGCAPRRLSERVDGVVTLDGIPLAEIRVLLEPKSVGNRDSGTGSYGLTDQNGRFVLRMCDNDDLGANLGLHSVILSDRRTEVDADAGDIGKTPKSRIPVKYLDSPLTFEVKSGGPNSARFELTSD
jgi:hypothetical protein